MISLRKSKMLVDRREGNTQRVVIERGGGSTGRASS